MRKIYRVLGSQLQPRWTLATTNIWRVNQWIETCSVSLCSSHYLKEIDSNGFQEVCGKIYYKKNLHIYFQIIAPNKFLIAVLHKDFEVSLCIKMAHCRE